MKKKTLVRLSVVAAAVLLLFLAGAPLFSINEQEQAVIDTLGVPTSVTSPGLHFKIPFLQKVYKVSTVINGFPIGYDVETREAIESESDYSDSRRQLRYKATSGTPLGYIR